MAPYDTRSVGFTVGNRLAQNAGFIDRSNHQYLDLMYQHIHQRARVYPDLDDNVVATSGAGAWALGSIVEIVPADTIASEYDVHFVNVSDMSSNDQFQLNLYSGGAGSEVEIGAIRFVRDTVFAQTGYIPIQIVPLPANTRLSAAIACAGGGSKTVDISVYYHQYA